jgi:predicted Holliday junction resolvase-like endonuclease
VAVCFDRNAWFCIFLLLALTLAVMETQNNVGAVKGKALSNQSAMKEAVKHRV